MRYLKVSGFCLKSPASSERGLCVVDLGGSDTEGCFRCGSVAARWLYPGSSAQRHVVAANHRLLFIEGQPDRLPDGGEDIEGWLEGRWGSFRGFEMAASGVRLFVDALGTRPMFVFERAGGWCAADKLATIVANEPEAQVNWPAVVEAGATGSLYASRDTTVRHTRRLEPGECLRMDALGGPTGRRRFSLPVEDLRAEVRKDAAGTLLECVSRAVQETWQDAGTWLLISGGLDSRLTMALAGAGRRAITLNYFPAETALAAAITEACGGAEFRVQELPAAHYGNMVRQAPLITGAMSDANFVNQIGIGAQWRQQGITSVAHAFLFDTVLKGWYLRRVADIRPVHASGLRLGGAQALVLEGLGRGPGRCVLGDVRAALTAEGAEVLEARVGDLVGSVASVVESELETGFERQVLSDIGRQVHFGFLLGWYEEADVVSPIFHPALWSWYAASSATDRYQGKALREALVRMGHRVNTVPDANTGAVVASSHASPWRDYVRRQALYCRLIQPLWRQRRRREAYVQITAARWLRSPQSLEAIAEGIAFLEGNALFRPAVGMDYLRRFAAGEDRYLVAALALMNAGRWSKFVTAPGEVCGAWNRLGPAEQ